MIVERVVGAILGGAIGDGWGRRYEGSVSRAPVVTPDKLVVTDDTQLTIATCESVVECGRADPERIAARFVVWFRAGRLHGLGASTLKALRDLDSGAHWALSGTKGGRAAGNGAAMRIAPLAFLLDPADQDQRRTLRDICRITHHHDEAYVGALAVARAIRLVSRPEYDIENLLADVALELPDSQVRDRISRFAGFQQDVSPLQVGETWGRSGFVADSVPLAILAAREILRRPFAEVVRRAVEAGGDTDTIGSIAGQIAGATIGFSALPEELLARLRDKDEFEAIARKFAGLVCAG
ncbi:MAG: ADP-ribosylglycohydrolase family protein [Planctomycetota bacterium]